MSCCTHKNTRNEIQSVRHNILLELFDCRHFISYIFLKETKNNFCFRVNTYPKQMDVFRMVVAKTTPGRLFGHMGVRQAYVRMGRWAYTCMHVLLPYIGMCRYPDSGFCLLHVLFLLQAYAVILTPSCFCVGQVL